MCTVVTKICRTIRKYYLGGSPGDFKVIITFYNGDGAKIRSKCEQYKFGEKSSKFFLNLEKEYVLLNQVQTLLCGEKEVTDKHKINQEVERFYKKLFTEKSNFKKKI